MPDYAEITRLLCHPSKHGDAYSLFSIDWRDAWEHPESFKFELLRLARERLSELEKVNEEIKTLRRAIGDSDASAS